MNLRSGVVTQYRPVKSKGFHVKGRASDPSRENVLISSDWNKQALAKSYGVIAMNAAPDMPAELINAYTYENQLSQLMKKKYLLIGVGQGFLYYAPAPLPLRPPIANPAAAKADPNFPAPPDTDKLEIEVVYTGPAVSGSETPARNTVMGGSALNYASAVYGTEWAQQRRWEWLHIVGHSLGGNNEVENLVAGTFDANTQMIPFEKRLHDATQRASATDPVTVHYVVTLYPDSWVAIDIGMEFSGCGDAMLPQFFPAQVGLEFDKLQYDLWLKG
jgi:hypothetical protein